MTTKTYSAKPEDITRQWIVLDAEGQTLGRLATRVATLLRGKHKPMFTPNMDCGDNVIIINAEKVVVTGNKASQKEYIHHTGTLGGLKRISYQRQMEQHPERILEAAIWGMLPHNRLGRKQITRLHVYTGAEHPHAAQQPVADSMTMEVAG
jgi:large subunit ribosomal protein L13